MPGQTPARLRSEGPKAGRASKAQAFPLAVLLALNRGDGVPEGDSPEQAQPAPQEQAAAVFSQDEASLPAAIFVAETAFDTEDGLEGDAGEWPSGED